MQVTRIIRFKVFCITGNCSFSGADLKERAGMTQKEASQFVTRLRNVMSRVHSLPMPVISAIDGLALGTNSEGFHKIKKNS